MSIQRLISYVFGARERRTRSTVRLPTFDTTGWHERQRSEANVVWTNDEGDSLSVNNSASPGVPPFSKLEVWRALCRQIAEDRGGGIVSGEAFEEGPTPLFQFIYKREDGAGYFYGGQLFIPHQEGVWLVAAGAREHGTTGTREALVTVQLAGQGRLEIDWVPAPDAAGTGREIPNWFRDPYDHEYSGRVLRSVADDEQYDALVPHHPLSRLRRTLVTVRRTLRFDA